MATVTKASFADELVIHVLVAANPKRGSGAAAKRFALYTPGMTVAQFKAACVALENGKKKPYQYLADLNWDSARNFIAVLPAGEKPAAPKK